MKKTLRLLKHNLIKSKLFFGFSLVQATLCIVLLAMSINYFYKEINRIYAFTKADLSDGYMTNGNINVDITSTTGNNLYNYLNQFSNIDNWAISIHHYGNFEGRQEVEFSAFNKNLAQKAYIPIVEGSWFDTSSAEVQIIIPNRYSVDSGLKIGDSGTFKYYNYSTSGKPDISFKAKVVGVYDYSLCTVYKSGGSILSMYNKFEETYGKESQRPLLLYIPNFQSIGAYGDLNSAYIDKSLVNDNQNLSKISYFDDTSFFVTDHIYGTVMQGIPVIVYMFILLAFSFAGLCGLSALRDKNCRYNYTVYILSGSNFGKCLRIEFMTQFIPYIIGTGLSVAVFIILNEINIIQIPSLCFIVSLGFNLTLMLLIFLHTLHTLKKNMIVSSIRSGSNERYY